MYRTSNLLAPTSVPNFLSRTRDMVPFILKKALSRVRRLNFGLITNWRYTRDSSSREKTWKRSKGTSVGLITSSNIVARKEQFYSNSHVSIKYVWPLCGTRRKAENCKSEPGLKTSEKSTNSGNLNACMYVSRMYMCYIYIEKKTLDQNFITK